MADESFQLPKSSYDELRNVIVAYGHLDAPGSLEDVAQYGGMSTTTVSRNNGFLASAGIIEGGKKKSPTKLGKELANALHDGFPQEVEQRWREVVTESDFLQKILAAVSIRKGMERSALESHIAYAAGEKKTGRVMTGTATLVEIMLLARLLAEADGKLVASAERSSVPVAPNSHPPLATPSGTTSGGASQPGQAQATAPAILPTALSQSVRGGVLTINVDIRVTCSVDELGTLGTQLRVLLDQLEKEANGSAANDSER